MSSLVPRAVLVTRPSDYEALLARHATRNQAKFFLQSRGQDIETVEQRHHHIHAVLKEVREAVPPGVELALHVAPDPLFTGSQMGQPFDAVDDLVDEIVVTHYGETPEQIAGAWRDRGPAAVPVRIAIWPRAPQFLSDDDVLEVAAVARRAGCAGLRVYHLGLLPARTIERVAALLR